MKKFTICMTVFALACLPTFAFGQGPHRSQAFKPQHRPAQTKQQHFQQKPAQFHPQPQPHFQKPPVHKNTHGKWNAPAPVYQHGKRPIPHGNHYPSPIHAPAPAVIIQEAPQHCHHDVGSGFSLTIGGKNSLFQFSTGF